MSTLNEIETLLNIEIDHKRLKDGKKRKNKNQYYYYEQAYYIVKLTQGKWMIAEDCRTTRKLLRNHCWCISHGYAMTNVGKISKYWHQKFLNYEQGLVCDHINRHRFDNRAENLRVITYQQNSRNMTKRLDNTSGKQGVSRWTHKQTGLSYWRVKIKDNNSKLIAKLFSIKNLGDAEAKRQAIAKRIELEELYGYDGE